MMWEGGEGKGWGERGKVLGIVFGRGLFGAFKGKWMDRMDGRKEWPFVYVSLIRAGFGVSSSKLVSHISRETPLTNSLFAPLIFDTVFPLQNVVGSIMDDFTGLISGDTD